MQLEWGQNGRNEGGLVVHVDDDEGVIRVKLQRPRCWTLDHCHILHMIIFTLTLTMNG